MRIPNQVLFLGKRRWPEFDCSEAPLPDRFILQLDARWRRATRSPSETMVAWLAQDSLGATEEDRIAAVTCCLLGQQRMIACLLREFITLRLSVPQADRGATG
jgi:hypothetical protein